MNTKYWQAATICGAIGGLCATGCFSSAFVLPQNARKSLEGLPTSSIPGRKDLYDRLQGYLDRYNKEDKKGRLENVVAFPEQPELRPMGASIVTMGYVGVDIGQKVLDQEFQPWTRKLRERATLINGETCDKAVDTSTYASPFAEDDLGNAPEPQFASVWFAVPKHYPVGRPASMAGVACGGASGSKDAQHVCLFSQLAIHPPEKGKTTDLVIIVPGMLDSIAQHYVRDAAAVLFSRGFSVLMVDMRDHGNTLRYQPNIPGSFGALEGKDIVAIADDMRTRPSCASRLGRIGLLGFSQGGQNVIRAFIEDRMSPLPSGHLGIDGGALAGTVRF